MNFSQAYPAPIDRILRIVRPKRDDRLGSDSTESVGRGIVVSLLDGFVGRRIVVLVSSIVQRVLGDGPGQKDLRRHLGGQ